MGSSSSKTVHLPKGIEHPGCLKDMYKKYGPECVDERLLIKWNGWTKGKFPEGGVLSVGKLMECRAMMEEKARPFKPELFGKWESEARIREEKCKWKKEQKDRKLEATVREEERASQWSTETTAGVYVQNQDKDSVAPIRRKPPHYDDTWASIYPPLPLQPPPVQPPPIQQAPLPQALPGHLAPQPPLRLLSPQLAPQSGLRPPKTPTTFLAPAGATATPTQLQVRRSERDNKGTGVERLGYGHGGVQFDERMFTLGLEEEEDSSSDESAESPSKAFLAPIIQMPGPAGLIQVTRPWLPEEMKSVATALPKPEEGIEAFIEAVRRMDRIYTPTTAEMAAILAKKCAPHWLQLREKLPLDIDRTTPAIPAAPPAPAVPSGEDRYQTALADLFTELRACYTATEDWTKMAVAQGLKETAREFLGRVAQAVTKHGGGTTNAQQKEALIRQYFVLGGRKEIMDYVKSHLVTWSTAAPNELLQYAENFERIKEKGEQQKQDDLQHAALSFYQSSVTRGRGINGRGGRGGGRSYGGGGSTGRECWGCGRMGHMARNCPSKWSQNGGRPSGQTSATPAWSQQDSA